VVTPVPKEVPVKQDGRHWHVTVTVAREPVEPLLMRSALLRFSEERPFLESMRFTSSGAEIKFWDEGESMIDVASLALRVWNEHRDSAGLPRWEVVGLEVVERTIHHNRGDGREVLTGSQELRPLSF
jgi:hypothetical protein